VVGAFIHLGQLLGVVLAQAHAVAHESSCMANCSHCLQPGNCKTGVRVVHNAHDVIWNTDVRIGADFVLVHVFRLNIIPMNDDVVGVVWTSLLMCHAQAVTELMDGNAHSVTTICLQVQFRAAILITHGASPAGILTHARLTQVCKATTFTALDKDAWC